MSEKLRITCPCGYENWVRPDQLGETIDCGMCGADLVVDEAAASGHFESPDTGELEDATAPESPVNPPHREASPPEGITLEERAEAARKIPSRPLSPFEDEEETPRPTSAKTAYPAEPPPQPRPRARSPFEADAPKPEERPGKGPFTLADQDGAKNAAYADRMEELRPKERRNRPVVIPTISPHDAPSGEKCSECGRELRGSWDRIETATGVICYVCSNQAVHDVPERLKTDQPQRRELRESDLIVHPVREEPAEYVPWYRDTESPEFKRVVLFLAVLTLAIGAYFFFFDNSAPVSTSTVAEETPAQVPLTPFTSALFQGWTVLSFFFSVFLGIYVVLIMDNAMPHGKFLPDVLLLGAICVPVSLFYFFTTALQGFLLQIPMAGPIFYALIMIAKWWIIGSVITRFIHMRFSQILFAGVIYFLLSRIVFRALGVLVFRAMGIL